MPEIAPTPTGSEGDTQQINQMYFDDDKSKTADLNAVRDLLDKRQSLSDQIEQLEQEKTAIEQQVKLEIHTMKTFRRCSGQSKLCTTLTSVF